MHKPSFQFYPGDWLRDPGVRRLSPREKGVYLELLILMFESGGQTNKMSLNELMNSVNFRLEENEIGANNEETCSVDVVFARVIDRLLECGVIHKSSNGGYFNKRMLRDLDVDTSLSEKRAEAGRLGSEKRWQNHDKAKWQNDGKPIANQNGKPIANGWQNKMANDSYSSSTSTSIINTLSNAPARECVDDPDGIIVPKNMPVSPQNAVEMCLGAGIPDDFVVKAYNEAYCVGFKDRGNPIMSWKQYVANYWNAHRNAQERRRKSYTPERPKDQYPNDRAEIPSL